MSGELKLSKYRHSGVLHVTDGRDGGATALCGKNGLVHSYGLLRDHTLRDRPLCKRCEAAVLKETS